VSASDQTHRLPPRNSSLHSTCGSQRAPTIWNWPWLEVALGVSILCLITQFTWRQFVAAWNWPRPGAQVRQQFQYNVGQKIEYWLYLPEDYASNSTETWPVLLFLQGSGARGIDLNRVKSCGPPAQIDEGMALPCIVVSPLCAVERIWESRPLIALLSHISTIYRVDESRFYVTGYSMGGSGTWTLLADMPNYFAAAAPLCGGGQPEYAARETDVAIWAFHGEQDTGVPLQLSRDMVNAVNAAGGNARLTVFSGVGHSICDRVYGDGAIYKWLLKQRRVSILDNDERATAALPTGQSFRGETP
jgi:pimeloyl-ACP methyl ester carboxylesterase